MPPKRRISGSQLVSAWPKKKVPSAR
jgi:hypothetical protein